MTELVGAFRDYYFPRFQLFDPNTYDFNLFKIGKFTKILVLDETIRIVPLLLYLYYSTFIIASLLLYLYYCIFTIVPLLLYLYYCIFIIVPLLLYLYYCTFIIVPLLFEYL